MGIVYIKQRITSDYQEYENFKKADCSLIRTSAVIIEDFSIELTIGDSWADNLSNEQVSMFQIEADQISIKPHSSIVIGVREEIDVPHNLYGLIMPTGTNLLEKGLFLASTKIEPGFSGRLKILVFNTTGSQKILIKDNIIASVIFFRTDHTVDSGAIRRKKDFPKRKRNSIEKIYAILFSDTKSTIMMILTFVCALCAILPYITPYIKNFFMKGN